MSMHEIPASGYVVPATELVKSLPPQLWLAYQQVVEQNNAEALAEWLDEYWPTSLPDYEGVYRPADEDYVDGDTMVQGELYVLFAESDLFEMVPKDETKLMEARGVTPKFCRWTVYG